MNRRKLVPFVFAACLLATGGCGAVPDLVMESARSAAIEAVDNAVSQIVDDAVRRLIDAGDDVLPMPAESDSEPQPE